MTGGSESSFLDVTDPRAVTLLMRERSRRVLLAFLGRENTVKAAADETGLDLRTLHRDVQALCAAGLLRVGRVQKRGGRGIRFYRAVSDAFFVNHLNTEASDFGEWRGPGAARLDHLFQRAAAREFARALRASGREWGIRLYVTSEAPGYRLDEGDRAAKRTDPLQEWSGPQAAVLVGAPLFELTDAAAREVQAEFIRLMRRARELSRAGTPEQRRPYLLRVGLAPLETDEARGLLRP